MPKKVGPMRQPLFSGKISAPLVVDSSVIINLNATGRASDIVRAFGVTLCASTVVRDELFIDRFNGRDDAGLARALADERLLEFLPFDDDGELIFASLVTGSADQTLDDGEAATLALGLVHGRTVVIDERKALRIAADRFAAMQVIATADILCSDLILSTFGREQVADLVFNGLTGARMGIPERHHGFVSEILGPRIAACRSLPASLRQVADSE
ncbi:hypothetical protein SAMN05216228_102888 [Rhizobium tibeticum]|uniref:PIN domain-containing protein n=1 Tax=Rhizobium tibeticum TaxID=501024 RepID=A0A1H8TEX3_9HYPH|nr:hypothetical protein RTCCBAU85039_5188 [Rhizobium tibeticum]SEO89640.1 hypothetical protein SAMN05216228_102888 [Rhizobium tibeticum]